MQVSPELLLVFRMDQFIHTLVHDVSLKKVITGDESISLCQHRELMQDTDVSKPLTHIHNLTCVAEEHRQAKQ